MDIKEVPNPNPKLKISKISMTCDETTDIPYPLQNYGFYYTFVGKPRSGKTNLLINLIAKRGKFYCKKFHKIVIWSPSTHTIEKPIPLPDERIYKELYIADVRKELDEIVERNDVHFKTLFIFDDCVQKMKKGMEELIEIVYNRRHRGLSIIITTQNWNGIPLELRKMTTGLFLFELPKREMEQVREDMINLSRKEWEDINKYVFDKPHVFMYINKDTHEMFKNFNRLVLPS